MAIGRVPRQDRHPSPRRPRTRCLRASQVSRGSPSTAAIRTSAWEQRRPGLSSWGPACGRDRAAAGTYGRSGRRAPIPRVSGRARAVGDQPDQRLHHAPAPRPPLLTGASRSCARVETARDRVVQRLVLPGTAPEPPRARAGRQQRVVWPDSAATPAADRVGDGARARSGTPPPSGAGVSQCRRCQTRHQRLVGMDVM